MGVKETENVPGDGGTLKYVTLKLETSDFGVIKNSARLYPG